MTVLMRKGENLTRLGDRQVEGTFTDHPWGHNGEQRKGMKLCCDFAVQALGSQNTAGNCSRVPTSSSRLCLCFHWSGCSSRWQI